MQQQPEQTIHSYIFEFQVLWDQLASCDPVWPRTEVAKVYANLCDHQLASCDPAWPSTKVAKVYANLYDHQHVWHLLMTVRDEFESIQRSLIHHSLLLKLDTMIKDLILEDVRLDIL